MKKNGFTLIELILVGFIFIVIGAIVFAGFQDFARCRSEIQAMGYDDREVGVFLKDSGLSRCDFVASTGLRKRFEAFQTGQVPLQGGAKSDGSMATGLAIGLAAGSAAGRR